MQKGKSVAFKRTLPSHFPPLAADSVPFFDIGVVFLQRVGEDMAALAIRYKEQRLGWLGVQHRVDRSA
jgi:hypothetical protein